MPISGLENRPYSSHWLGVRAVIYYIKALICLISNKNKMIHLISEQSVSNNARKVSILREIPNLTKMRSLMTTISLFAVSRYTCLGKQDILLSNELGMAKCYYFNNNIFHPQKSRQQTHKRFITIHDQFIRRDIIVIIPLLFSIEATYRWFTWALNEYNEWMSLIL